MILNTIEWIYNLKLKKKENDYIILLKNLKRKKCEKTLLWIMSTLLENNNNIILWESVKWLLLWVLHFMT